MAVVVVNSIMSAGITYSHRTDSSLDWSSVPNDVYFFDIGSNQVYYKDTLGNILSIFNANIGSSSYSMTLGFTTTTLTANSTFLAGGIPNIGAVTLFNQRPSRQHMVPKTGTIEVVDIITAVPGAKAGTGSPSIEVWNITQNTNAVVTTINLYSSGGLTGDSRIDQFNLVTPLAVTKGDIIQIRIVTPNWSTAPGSVVQFFHLHVEN